MKIERSLQFRGRTIRTREMTPGDRVALGRSYHSGQSLGRRLLRRVLEEPLARGGYEKVLVTVLEKDRVEVSRVNHLPRMAVIPEVQIAEYQPPPPATIFQGSEIGGIEVRRRFPGFKTVFKYTADSVEVSDASQKQR